MDVRGELEEALSIARVACEHVVLGLSGDGDAVDKDVKKRLLLATAHNDVFLEVSTVWMALNQNTRFPSLRIDGLPASFREGSYILSPRSTGIHGFNHIDLTLVFMLHAAREYLIATSEQPLCALHATLGFEAGAIRV